MTPQGSVWLARLWALLVIFTVVLLVGPAGTYIYTGVSNTDRQTPRPPALPPSLVIRTTQVMDLQIAGEA
jgi:hypothetical protein